MKRLHKSDGFIGVDIAIFIVIMFIFISIISLLIYKFNSLSNSLKLQNTATYIAIDEIEKIKQKSFTEFEGLNRSSQVDKSGKQLENQKIIGQTGFYKTTKIEDYTDFESTAIPDIVKKITIKISYKFAGKEEKVELSTIITKET